MSEWRTNKINSLIDLHFECCKLYHATVNVRDKTITVWPSCSDSSGIYIPLYSNDIEQVLRDIESEVKLLLNHVV